MRIAIVVTMAVMVSTGGMAAEFGAVSPGQRIRVSIRPEDGDVPSTLRGRVLAVEPSFLTVKADGASQAVVIRSDQVARLERLLKPGRRTKGALIGGGILGGAMLGLFVAYCSGDWGCSDVDPDRVVAVIGGATAIGALLGAGAAPGDRWVEVPPSRSAAATPATPRFRLVPTRGGGVAASVAIALPLNRER
jgi:hypothetical protein